LVSLACNLDANILTAAFPLLEEGRVEALEWSFDALFGVETMPPWFAELLAAYSQQHRLIGHGVYFSLLSGRWTPEQQRWLQELSELSTRFRFDHVTEHFGFFTGQNFHSGAPLPVPYSPTTLRLGQDRMSRLAQACGCPVGLENLAFAYGLDEVKRHGEFLDKLLEPVNGFIILDLHNLYCQLHNFSVSYDALIALYPLHRVREIHISGGSWEDSVLVPNKKIRRDTHDEAVPKEVFALLERTMPQCPQLKYVVLEQLGTGLATASSQAQYRQDFARMEALVTQHRAGRPSATIESFMPQQPLVPGPVVTDETLSEQQHLLSHLLETAPSVAAAQLQLNASPLANTNWQIEKWEPHMLETAISIAQKWKK
jgi:uncharacterized protein (UPF0276 family)